MLLPQEVELNSSPLELSAKYRLSPVILFSEQVWKGKNSNVAVQTQGKHRLNQGIQFAITRNNTAVSYPRWDAVRRELRLYEVLPKNPLALSFHEKTADKPKMRTF